MEGQTKTVDLLGYSPEEYALFRKHAIIVLLGFSILYCALYSGRLNMGLAIPVMIEEMGWTKEELGILTGILFWTYGMGHLFNGRLGEIFGINRFIVAGVILSAAANIFISFQFSLIIIAIAWGFNGYFQSMLWSPGMALIAKWWPGKNRGFATGFCNAFSGFGSVFAWIGVYFAFTVAPGMGWRAAFTIPMIGMLIFVVIYKIIVKQSPAQIGLKEYQEEEERAAYEEELKRIVEEKGKIYPYIHLLKQWQFIMWCLIVAGSNMARYGLLTWIPTYYVDVMGVDVKQGIIGTVLLPLGMALGTFIVPWATDKYCSTNRLPAVIICAAVSAITVFIFPSLTSMGSAAALLFLAGFFIYAINGVVWAYATDVGGRVFGGTATGILDCAAYLGASVQAVLFGGVLTRTGNWNFVFACITGICIFIIVCALVSGGTKAFKRGR